MLSHLTHISDVRELLHLGRLRPVQREALRPILSGRSVLITGPTGCGKTEACLIPVFEKILACQEESGFEDTRVIYICPTKALINDLVSRFEWIEELLGIRFARKTGDVNEFVRVKTPHILVTTPESLDVLLGTPPDCNSVHGNLIQKRLRTISTVIIDEIHQFAGTPRGTQLGWLLSRLMEHTGSRFQMISMSATISDIESVKKFMERFVREVVVISSNDFERQIDFSIRIADSLDTVHECILKVRERWGARKILIFANSRIECDMLFNFLNTCRKQDEQIFLHYSTLSLEEREETEEAFKNFDGDCICIATSTLELGIDIGDIDAVILYGPPCSQVSFLQKTGRSNRRSQRIKVLGLIRGTGEYRKAGNDFLIFKSLISGYCKKKLEKACPADYPSVAVQQIFSTGRRFGCVPVKKLKFLAAFPFEKITDKELESIIRELSRQGYLDRPVKHLDEYAFTEKAEKLIKMRLIFANFSSEGTGRLSVMRKDGRCIAEYPYFENQALISSGEILNIAGRNWKIVDVSLGRLSGRIIVEESEKKGGIQLKHGSLMAPVSFMLARNIPEALLEDISFDAHDEVIKLHQKLRDSILKKKYEAGVILFTPVLRDNGDVYYRYYTFAGTVGNFILARWLFNGKGLFDEICLEAPEIVNPGEKPVTPEILNELISANRAALAGILGCSRFFSMLPPDLQVKELTERLESELVDYLLNFHSFELREI